MIIETFFSPNISTKTKTGVRSFLLVVPLFPVNLCLKLSTRKPYLKSDESLSWLISIVLTETHFLKNPHLFYTRFLLSEWISRSLDSVLLQFKEKTKNHWFLPFSRALISFADQGRSQCSAMTRYINNSMFFQKSVLLLPWSKMRTAVLLGLAAIVGVVYWLVLLMLLIKTNCWFFQWWVRRPSIRRRWLRPTNESIW